MTDRLQFDRLKSATYCSEACYDAGKHVLRASAPAPSQDRAKSCHCCGKLHNEKLGLCATCDAALEAQAKREGWPEPEPTPTASLGAPALKRSLEHLADALADLPSGALATPGLAPASPARAEAPGGLTLEQAVEAREAGWQVEVIFAAGGEWQPFYSFYSYEALYRASFLVGRDTRYRLKPQPSPAAASTGRVALLVDEAMRNRRFPNGELVRSDMDGVAERVARAAERHLDSVGYVNAAEELRKEFGLGQGSAGTPGERGRRRKDGPK